MVVKGLIGLLIVRIRIRVEIVPDRVVRSVGIRASDILVIARTGNRYGTSVIAIAIKDDSIRARSAWCAQWWSASVKQIERMGKNSPPE